MTMLHKSSQLRSIVLADVHINKQKEGALLYVVVNQS